MRNVVITAVLAALFAAGSLPAAAQLTAPASAASSPGIASTAGPEPKLSAADQKRIEAIQQYQHDLVNVVALRADPDYLLGAAILSKPFKNQTPGLDFDALSERAATAPDAGAAAQWVRLDLCTNKDDCPNAKAFDYLKKNAAGNAAVWLVAMDVAAENKDAKAEHAALEKAAATQAYDDYYGKALAGVAKAVEVLPPLADTMQGAHDGQPDNGDGVRVLVAASATQNHLRPNLKPLVDACSKDAVAKHHDTREACLKLAHTLTWGSSPIARAVGLHIQGELEPAKKAENDQAARDVAWQVQAYSSLLQRALTDQALATQWLAAAGNGGTELSLILATLRANNVSTDAPADAAPASAGSSGP
ncbi:MAG: hypothetical protein OJF61_002611 [Rhodanobacteraceae bacterium]|jgi:hypothetical protein|nr:MAG: hypothetical protein OJF61_002611 [Rhodanobacteraceae bacterium]